MAAAMTTLDVYERDDAFDHMVAMGERLWTGIEAAATVEGHAIELSGPVTMPTLLFSDDADGERAREFARKAAGHGALLPPFLNWNLSLAHTEADIDAVAAAAASAFAATPAA